MTIKLVTRAMADSLINAHVTMLYMGRKLLGTVKGIDGKGDKRRLYVEHFNGEAWPVEPLLEYDQVGVLIPDYEESEQ